MEELRKILNSKNAFIGMLNGKAFILNSVNNKLRVNGVGFIRSGLSILELTQMTIMEVDYVNISRVEKCKLKDVDGSDNCIAMYNGVIYKSRFQEKNLLLEINDATYNFFDLFDIEDLTNIEFFKLL